MKKHLFLFLLFYIPLLISAQNLIILDSVGNNVNGQTITYFGSVNDSLVKFHFGVKNISSGSLDVKMKRSEIGKLQGTQNYFCWSICYIPAYSGAKPTWTDMNFVPMIPDSVYENFSAYFLPNGISGVAGFHYVLFDVNNPNDSAFVDIVFDISVGIDEFPEMKREITISPNPVIDKLFIQLPKNGYAENPEIEIFNIIGEKIENHTLPGKTKAFCINTTNYYPGIYFCILKENGTVVSTKKIVVSH